MSVSLSRWLSVFAVALLGTSPALAAIPYAPVPVFGPPVIGPGAMPPSFVYGKEYSHDFDFSVIGPTPDPEQVINWDGTGGTSDGIDYSGSRLEWTPDQQVDAIASQRDALYDQTIRDESHLTFSHDDLIAMYGPGGGLGLFTVPSAGSVFISNGNAIGGAGEVSVEGAGLFTPSPLQSVWAKQTEVNGMPLPKDVDGTELWGPGPLDGGDPEFPFIGDADKYSLDVDTPSGVSVWNASGTPYISQSMIVGAVTSLLGPIPGSAFSLHDDHQGQQAINLDALMVSDIIGDPQVFDFDPIGGGEPHGEELFDQNGGMIEPFGREGEMRGDSIIFSIRQIVDPADPDGYYSTGSELFVLDALTGASYLTHGGHVWDQGYALGALAYVSGPDGNIEEGYGIIDINAIEAIGHDQEGVLPALSGDYNHNGVVDAADYTVWRDSEGASGYGLAADGNGDHVVNVIDRSIWIANFGAIAPSLAVSVPEPTTALLVLVTLVGAGFTRRR